MAASGSGPAHTPPSTTAATKLLAVMGHPIGHSRSPELHSAAIAAAGHDAVYVALDVDPVDFAAAIAGLRAIGFLGANVTIPHKRAALRIADRATAVAEAVGAANTLFWDGEDLVADNTDVPALVTVLGQDCGVVDGDPVTIFGAGGAARAAASAAGQLGAAVTISARRPEAVEQVSAVAASSGAQPPSGATPRVVINATPLGRHGENLPAPFMGLGEGRVVLDLNYGPESPFLASARAAGSTSAAGSA